MKIFPPRYPWQAAICAGITAAAVSLAIETPLVWLFTGRLPWAAARMAAAIVLGPSVLEPPVFDFWLIALAFVVHFSLSIALTLILAWIIHGENAENASLTGAAFGVMVFVVNMYGLTPIFFPWFVALRDAITLGSHVVLGVTMAWCYTQWSSPR